jgi:cation diffusion facilitator family transporter
MGSINDELGLIAALFGTIAVLLGVPIADPIATIIVAALIAYGGIKLFLENFSLLLGKAPGVEYSEKIETLARSVPGVLGVHDVRVEYIGPDTLHAGLHIEVAPGTTIEEANRLSKEVEQKIHSNSEIGYCYVQAEPLMTERKE